ncbi:STAS domain-containing protein [Streptomyces sp. NPDC001941]|uniref:STAS domain-containing protein n=1 Tax=Streptomyces sp. NPDC001941 TaxID=3154659 RepID=UPI00331A9574
MTRPSPRPLRVDVVPGVDPVLVLVAGEADLATVPELSRALAPLVGKRAQVDLSGVEFMDSTGLSVLLVHRHRSTQVGGDLKVISMSTAVGHLLDLAGVREYLTTL